jgi:hypothetical protein
MARARPAGGAAAQTVCMWHELTVRLRAGISGLEGRGTRRAWVEGEAGKVRPL